MKAANSRQSHSSKNRVAFSMPHPRNKGTQAAILRARDTRHGRHFPRRIKYIILGIGNEDHQATGVARDQIKFDYYNKIW
jgi:hypothetical protein